METGSWFCISLFIHCLLLQPSGPTTKEDIKAADRETNPLIQAGGLQHPGRPCGARGLAWKRWPCGLLLLTDRLKGLDVKSGLSL